MGPFEGVGEHGIGALHFGQSIELILAAVENHGGRWGAEGEDFGEIQILGQEGYVDHPSVSEGLVEQQIAPSGREANRDGDFDARVDATEENRAHAAARKAGATDAIRIDFGAGGEDIECALIFNEIDAGPGCAGGKKTLFHNVFVGGGKPVVFINSVEIVRRGWVDAAITNLFRYIFDHDAAAGEREGIMHEDGVAALGNFVSPSDAAVVMILMGYLHGPRRGVGSDNLAPAEKFVAAVVV